MGYTFKKETFVRQPLHLAKAPRQESKSNMSIRIIFSTRRAAWHSDGRQRGNRFLQRRPVFAFPLNAPATRHSFADKTKRLSISRPRVPIISPPCASARVRERINGMKELSRAIDEAICPVQLWRRLATPPRRPATYDWAPRTDTIPRRFTGQTVPWRFQNFSSIAQ